MTKGTRLGLIAVAVAIAAGAFVVARSGGDDNKSDKPAGGASGPTATARDALPPPPERLAVRGGKPVGGVKKIVVKKGDDLRLEVSSDAPNEIHMHGYDVKRNAAPGKPARFRVKTDLEGVFEIEVEDTGTKIANLVVEPS